MNCIKRSWLSKSPRSLPTIILPCGQIRGPFLRPLPALKTSGTGAPLSLNDIISFESEQPSVVEQEVAPDRRVDELIDRAARVLREVNTVLAADADPQPSQQELSQRQRYGSATAPRPPGGPSASAGSTATIAGDGDPGPSAGTGAGSPLSRAVFGGSAEVSELQATLTRTALKKTLEAATAPSRPDASGAYSGGAQSAEESDSSLNSSSASELQRQPTWAQALFTSTSTSSISTAALPSKSGGKGTSHEQPMGQSRKPQQSVSTTSPGVSGGSPDGSWALLSSRPLSTSSADLTSTARDPTQQLPLSPPLQLAPAPTRRPLAAWAPLAFAEADLSVPTELLLKSEETILMEEARSAVLPPLQSVVDLTAAVRPPTRGLDLDMPRGVAQQEEVMTSSAVAVTEDVLQDSALGRRLLDGAGRLADGTRFEKLSGTDTGPDGYVKKWEVLRGVTGDGQVQWEECWWQASNRYGLRELGAFKKGIAESGAAWVEEWKEVMSSHPTNLRLVIERTAHKWARDEHSDEWEEKWGECFEEAGRVHKWADKWAKAGSNVWHERWGEDYDGRGACQKWTDKWAERLLHGGGQEQWGDKWTETFGHGKGTKHGEVWSSSSDGSRYNRWWNEEHFGDSRVRKWGNSTSGEYWDTVEHMDTFYNPVPHFGFQHAVGHSPQLWAVPLPTPDEGDGNGSDDDGLGVGLGRL